MEAAFLCPSWSQIREVAALHTRRAVFLYNRAMKRLILIQVIVIMLISGCVPVGQSPAGSVTATGRPPTIQARSTLVETTPTSTASPTPSPQARLTTQPAGPDAENFATGTNPLTGLRLQETSMLDLPAVLVSISNMPPTARPQAGLSFAPWIYELFIGEGTTRFMSVFYGDLPRRIPNDLGDCAVNTKIFQPGSDQGSSKKLETWIGKRIWLDENKDGVQDPWEAGLGGVCISLVETTSSIEKSRTSTDSNGYYALDATGLQVGKSYTLTITHPAAFQFSLQDVGNNDQDSDANPVTGEIHFDYAGKTDSSLDVGLILVKPGPTVYSPSEIAAQRTYVGPIRSGRLTYNDFAQMYPAGCLVYASAGDGIRQQLDGCEIIFGEQPGVSPNTALLDVTHLKELAQKSKIANQPVNYSGHLFDTTPPAGGRPASSLWTYFHAFSQSSWLYDPLSGSYLRQTDDGDGKGIFHTDTDRLTGRQLAFENVIIIMANYQIFRHGQYDIDLCCGFEGYAFLFRDGQMYRIRWSTNNRKWEQSTGLLRPLHFTGADKQAFALKPGRTWVSIMTINSVLKDLQKSQWQALFAMPDDLAPVK